MAAQQLPSVDDVLGPAPKGGDLPSADDLLGPGPTPAEQFRANHPVAGAIHDWMISASPALTGRWAGPIMDAFGQGAKQGWGAVTFGPDTEEALTKAGVYRNFQGDADSIGKTINEAIIRPLAWGVDTVLRAASALQTGGGGGGTESGNGSWRS